MHLIKTPERRAALIRLLRKGLIRDVQIEGNEGFILPEPVLRILEQTDYRENYPDQASIIAPLDNLLWDRVLIEKMFGFHYRWEVYKPESEREYGYYVLPVLYGDRFIARFEPGRTSDGSLEIKNWWWEGDVDISDELRNRLRSCFLRFLKYLKTDSLIISAKTGKSNKLAFLSNL